MYNAKNRIETRIKVVLCTKDFGKLEDAIHEARESGRNRHLYVGIGRRGKADSSVVIRRSLQHIEPVDENMLAHLWEDSPEMPAREEEVLDPLSTWVYAMFYVPGGYDCHPEASSG